MLEGDSGMNLPDIENAILQAWAEEPRTGWPGPDSNFFLVGGNSLAAVRMVKRRSATGRHDGRGHALCDRRSRLGVNRDLRHVRVTLSDPQADAVAFDVVTIDGSQREPAVINAALARFAGQEFDLGRSVTVDLGAP